MSDQKINSQVLGQLYDVIESRRGDDLKTSYTAKLFKNGRGKMYADAGAVYIRSNQFSYAKEYALKAIKFNPWYWKVWIVLLIGFLRIKINQ